MRIRTRVAVTRTRRSRELLLDDIVQQYVRDRLTFRFAETDTETEALRIEAEARAGALGKLPLLNPTA